MDPPVLNGHDRQDEKFPDDSSNKLKRKITLLNGVGLIVGTIVGMFNLLTENTIFKFIPISKNYLAPKNFGKNFIITKKIFLISNQKIVWNTYIIVII